MQHMVPQLLNIQSRNCSTCSLCFAYSPPAAQHTIPQLIKHLDDKLKHDMTMRATHFIHLKPARQRSFAEEYGMHAAH